MAAESSAPLRADAERNRRRILAAAAEAFAEQGVEAGVDDIARRAGVGIATLYRRFPTKDHLVVELLKERYTEHLDNARRALEVEDPWTAFSALLYDIVGRRARDRTYDEVMTAGRYHRHPEVQRLYDQSHALITAVLERAQAARVVRPELTYADLLLLTHGLAATARAMRGVDDAYWERALAVTLAGLRPGTPLPGTGPSRQDARTAFSAEPDPAPTGA